MSRLCHTAASVLAIVLVTPFVYHEHDWKVTSTEHQLCSLNQSMGIISIGLILIWYIHTFQARARQGPNFAIYDTRNPLPFLHPSPHLPKKHPWLVGMLWKDSSSLRTRPFKSSSRQVRAVWLRQRWDCLFSLPFVRQRCRLAR